MKLFGFIAGFGVIFVLILIAFPFFGDFSPDTEWAKIAATVITTMLTIGGALCLIWKLAVTVTNKLLGRE
ncbi:MAG: hypothetical protein WC250_01935 [Candidatus Paceibacterota bacterium]|jgi:cytochrome c biogenesis protein CcdA